jgi:hypothetical protein
MCVPFWECIVALSCVNLIPEASWAVVLSDVGTGAARRPGELPLFLKGSAVDDRDPSGAMRPGLVCTGCKSFSLYFVFGAAELFTEGCGELLGLLLAFG